MHAIVVVSVITLICKGVFFLISWPLGERNEEKGENKPQNRVILSFLGLVMIVLINA
jgi:hypothetical protein